jgi:hypothetical protein
MDMSNKPFLVPAALSGHHLYHRFYLAFYDFGIVEVDNIAANMGLYAIGD